MGSADSLALDGIDRRTDSRRIDKSERNPGNRTGMLGPIARRARLIADNGEVATGQPVRQCRLAGIRSAYEHGTDSIEQKPSPFAPNATIGHTGTDVCDPPGLQAVEYGVNLGRQPFYRTGQPGCNRTSLDQHQGFSRLAIEDGTSFEFNAREFPTLDDLNIGFPEKHQHALNDAQTAVQIKVDDQPAGFVAANSNDGVVDRLVTVDDAAESQAVGNEGFKVERTFRLEVRRDDIGRSPANHLNNGNSTGTGRGKTRGSYGILGRHAGRIYSGHKILKSRHPQTRTTRRGARPDNRYRNASSGLQASRSKPAAKHRSFSVVPRVFTGPVSTIENKTVLTIR